MLTDNGLTGTLSPLVTELSGLSEYSVTPVHMNVNIPSSTRANLTFFVQGN